MPVLDSDILDDLRDSVAEIIDDVFPDVMDVQRTTTLARDVTSPESFTDIANLVHENVGCRYKALKADEKFTYQRIDTVTDYRIKLAAKYLISDQDVLKIKAKGNIPAFDIQVTGLGDKSNGVMQEVWGKRL